MLDPAQNHTFRDHYLEVDLDLSDVVFLATANMVDTIPGPLLDRMELVRLDGYTEDEKVFIARDSPAAAPAASGRACAPGEVDLDDDALRRIVTDYTREAGVRGLERELGKAGSQGRGTLVAADPTDRPVARSAPTTCATYLGRQKFFAEVADAHRRSRAWPPAWRSPAPAATSVHRGAPPPTGEPGLTLTGQLGDVMKESAQIALSYVRSHADELGVDGPGRSAAGSTCTSPPVPMPKDGPSAGVTMTTALVSLLTDRPVKPTVGMTGEVTLQGKVLPIGGVKQKVLAAHRAGLTEVILPAAQRARPRGRARAGRGPR